MIRTSPVPAQTPPNKHLVCIAVIPSAGGLLFGFHERCEADDLHRPLRVQPKKLNDILCPANSAIPVLS